MQIYFLMAPRAPKEVIKTINTRREAANASNGIGRDAILAKVLKGLRIFRLLRILPGPSAYTDHIWHEWKEHKIFVGTKTSSEHIL